MSPRSRGVIAASALGMGSTWNIADVGAVAEPIAAHYEISLAAVGLFTTTLFAAELVSMAAIGGLVRRFGVKGVGLLALGLCATGNLLTLAVDGAAAALALRLAVGLGVGLGFVGGTAYVHEVGGGPLAQGIYGGLSLATGGLAVAVVPSLEGPLGWQAPFLTAAALAALAAAVLMLGPDVRGAPATVDESGFIRLLGDRRLVRFAIVQSAAFGLGVVLSNWVVTLLSRRGGYDTGTAGLIGALILIVGIVGRPAGGLYAQLRPERTRALLLLALLLGASGSVLLGFGPPLALALVGSIAVGFAAGVPFGPIVAGLGRTFTSSPGAAFGAMNTYALAVIVLGSPLVGASFSLPGDGLLGFAAAAAYWLLAAALIPGRELLSPPPAEASETSGTAAGAP